MKDQGTGRLHLPAQGSGFSRRDALRLGAIGIGGIALGGPLLAACGSDDSSAGSGGAKGSIKAHWVYIGPPDDQGWTQRHHEGYLAAAAALGDKMVSGYTPNIGFDAGTTQLFQQLVDDKNDIIFMNTEYSGLMTEVADANPQVKWAETNGHHFTENCFGYYLAHETTAYLLGVAAAHLADNGRIGYIGAFPTATAYNDVNGMLLGARSVNPEATVETVMVSTFYDPQAAAQASDALLNNGVDFLFGVMDEPTFLNMAEEAGVWTGYWNGDFPEQAPNWYTAGFDIGHGLGPFYTQQCQAVLNGSWAAPSSAILLDTPLGSWGPKVPQDVRDAVATAEAALKSGDLHVYEGPLMDNKGNQVLAAGETIDSLGAYEINWAVEGVSGLE